MRHDLSRRLEQESYELMPPISIGITYAPVKICLFGAAPDTSNLGVSALFLSVLNEIVRRTPGAQLTVFDHGNGPREDQVLLHSTPFQFTRCGANFSRRFYRRDSLLNMRASAAVGGLGNPGVQAIKEADAVFDISGGDSFSDIYGNKRFQMITQPKRLVLRQRTPLILLPQTFGPFNSPQAEKVAREIISGATMVWARDKQSFHTVKTLLGNRFVPENHATGVDVAFAMPKRRPEDLPIQLKEWLAKDRLRPVIGLNVSGLIYNEGAAGSRRFGFQGDYRDIIHRLLRRLVDSTDANIVLVPHVLSKFGHYESDPQACSNAAATIESNNRVFVLNKFYNSMEMKWVISKMDFFCGTRMHSAIAGLSTGVPTSAIAYSKKTFGVFETCGQGDCVVDPRIIGPEQCVERIWQLWLARDNVEASLSEHIPAIEKQSIQQMDRIFGALIEAKRTPQEREAQKFGQPNDAKF